jgi:hypothetical protein
LYRLIFSPHSLMFGHLTLFLSSSSHCPCVLAAAGNRPLAPALPQFLPAADVLAVVISWRRGRGGCWLAQRLRGGAEREVAAMACPCTGGGGESAAGAGAPPVSPGGGSPVRGHILEAGVGGLGGYTVERNGRSRRWPRVGPSWKGSSRAVAGGSGSSWALRWMLLRRGARRPRRSGSSRRQRPSPGLRGGCCAGSPEVERELAGGSGAVATASLRPVRVRVELQGGCPGRPSKSLPVSRAWPPGRHQLGKSEATVQCAYGWERRRPRRRPPALTPGNGGDRGGGHRRAHGWSIGPLRTVPPCLLVFLRVSRMLVAFVFCAVTLANPSEHVLELAGYDSVVCSSSEGKKLQSPTTTCSMVLYFGIKSC